MKCIYRHIWTIPSPSFPTYVSLSREFLFQSVFNSSNGCPSSLDRWLYPKFSSQVLHIINLRYECTDSSVPLSFCDRLFIRYWRTKIKSRYNNKILLNLHLNLPLNYCKKKSTSVCSGVPFKLPKLVDR